MRVGEGVKELLEFALERTEDRILVYDGKMNVVYRNACAEKFLARYPLPPEVPAIAERILHATCHGELGREFPGKIGFAREIGGRYWHFRIEFRATPLPLVGVFIRDETVSDRFDLNALRKEYRLTRRELDLMAHLLDGLSNLEIAENLCISEQTVKDHLANIYRKVGVKDRYSILRHLVATARPSAQIPSAGGPAARAGDAPLPG